jgi:hypothetical protein
MLEDSSREEVKFISDDAHYYWQSSTSSNVDQGHLMADQSLQHEESIEKIGQVFETTSLFKQVSEDNKKKEIEEKKIKKSFTNLFMRCLIEETKSIPYKENSNQNSQNLYLQTENNAPSEPQKSSAESNTPEEINLDREELTNCTNKISDHLASEYQKLLKKLEPPREVVNTNRIIGLQAGDDENSSEHNQEELKEENPKPIQEEIKDPIIYCGVGIRMKLETEIIDSKEEYYLEIVDIFRDSALDKEKHMNKRISEVAIKKSDDSYEYQSITSIFEECKDIDKFYAKISSIFHDPSEEKIGLKFKGEHEGEEYEGEEYAKKIFRPEGKESIKLENIKDVNYSLNSISSSNQLSKTSQHQRI